MTAAFIDEIIANPEKYACLPLYADVRRLRAKDYRSLGHMYNRMTGKFMSTQIGGICDLRKVEDEYGVSLMGEARIPKREADVCQCVMELYGMGALNFSFEIKYAKADTIEIDGVQYVDASENNALTGMAIVSVPAYKEAKALSLIAEETNAADGTDTTDNGGVDTMTLDEALAAIAQKDQLIAELEEKVTAATKLAEDMEKEKENQEKEENPEDKEELEMARKKCAEDLEAANNTIVIKEQMIIEKEKTITEIQDKLNEAEAKLNEFEPMRAELEAMKAEAAAKELKEKQDKAKAFAEAQGLDLERTEVAEAIASMNYEALASISMETAKKTEDAPKLASFMTNDGIDVKGLYGGLLETH